MSRALIPILLVLGAAALYLPHLQNAPLYASHDEIIYSLQAHALATTGRDLSGSFLPMFIEYPAEFGRPTWNTPLLIYAIAATLKVLPFSEFAIRLPMVIFAILDVLLIYLSARIIFEAEWFAVAAATLLALTRRISCTAGRRSTFSCRCRSSSDGCSALPITSVRAVLACCSRPGSSSASASWGMWRPTFSSPCSRSQRSSCCGGGATPSSGTQCLSGASSPQSF